MFIIILILILTGNIKVFDNTIYTFIISFRCNSLDNFFKAITIFGNIFPVILIVIIIFFKLTKSDKILLIENTLLTVVINQLIKYIIKRPRPDHLRLIRQGGYSFPSGHSMIAVALYGFLIYIINRNIKDKKLRLFFNIFFIFLIISIGISRIYLGVHYPSDVLGEYFLSIIILIFNIKFYNKYFRGN